MVVFLQTIGCKPADVGDEALPNGDLSTYKDHVLSFPTASIWRRKRVLFALRRLPLMRANENASYGTVLPYWLFRTPPSGQTFLLVHLHVKATDMLQSLSKAGSRPGLSLGLASQGISLNEMS